MSQTKPKLLHLIPNSLTVEPSSMDAATYLVGLDEGATDSEDRWAGGTLTIGTIAGDTPEENVDGIAIYNDEMPEEGCALLAEFSLEPTKVLREHLAVVHADGGHHEQEVGTEQALLDATTRYHKLLKLHDAVTEYLAARDAYEEESGILKTSHAQTKKLPVTHPTSTRWVKARLALSGAFQGA